MCIKVIFRLIKPPICPSRAFLLVKRDNILANIYRGYILLFLMIFFPVCVKKVLSLFLFMFMLWLRTVFIFWGVPHHFFKSKLYAFIANPFIFCFIKNINLVCVQFVLFILCFHCLINWLNTVNKKVQVI